MSWSGFPGNRFCTRELHAGLLASVLEEYFCKKLWIGRSEKLTPNAVPTEASAHPTKGSSDSSQIETRESRLSIKYF